LLLLNVKVFKVAFVTEIIFVIIYCLFLPNFLFFERDSLFHFVSFRFAIFDDDTTDITFVNFTIGRHPCFAKDFSIFDKCLGFRFYFFSSPISISNCFYSIFFHIT
jgi:hypothetical protein